MFRLVVAPDLFAAMVAHARAALPAEACGFLAGVLADGVGRVTVHIPLTNELASPTEYAVPVADLLRAAKEMRAAGVRELAVYHSHPTSEPVPSRRDIDRNGYGDAVAHVIIGLAGEEPDVRAWWLTDDGPRPAELDRG